MNMISNGAKFGAATATHIHRWNGRVVGTSTSNVGKHAYDRELELEDALGLRAALSLKYGTTPTGEIDFP